MKWVVNVLKLLAGSCLVGMLLSVRPVFLPDPQPIDSAAWQQMNAEQRLEQLYGRRFRVLGDELQGRGLRLGLPVFIRIFKEELQLELWLQPAPGAPWVMYQRWPIAAMSGGLGPKLREGDRQAPEGIYHVTAAQMNPMSKYHLSFNVGYPNEVDAALGRTGSFIMVHGKDVSVGCFAMTDEVMEDIYLLVHEALLAGQGSVPVHCFPFHLTPERLATARGSAWYDFWQVELQPIYAAFQLERRVPGVRLEGGHYLLD
jgi:murein L,D-transpeptidase YafK